MNQNTCHQTLLSEKIMSNWGDGYKTGYRAALNTVNKWIQEQSGGCQNINIDAFMEEIYKDSTGGPSMFAVANKCCGGVDAHSVGCR